jgi:S1-C subfamily serine protease
MTTTLSALENQVTEAVERLSESVVSIDSVRVTRDFRYGLVPIEGKGSGLIIDRKGYVITNNHVIDEATRVQIHLKDGRTFLGEVVGSDASTDIAVIKVDADNLPAASLGDSEKLKVGQIALAIGNTLGLQGGPTVSMGVVSALGRPLPGTDFIFEGLIQTDTAINPGNSGGPLADIGGNVIGMNTAMIPFAQGVGFAIPVNTMKWVVQQILEKGRVIRPWLGISGANMNPAIARRYDLPADSGVLVVEVDTRGPAYEAGMRVGDVIIQIGSHAVKQMKDVLMALSKLAIKEEVEVGFVRLNAKRKALLRLRESPIAVSASRERIEQ